MQKECIRFAKLWLCTLCIMTGGVLRVQGDEGMWLPSEIKSHIRIMRKHGLRLRAEDLYNPYGASLKDAVVQFGDGCSGGFVSADGYILTNHHCAYSSIQALSSVDHNYLCAGYGLQKEQKELPCQGLHVKVLAYMRDISADVFYDMPLYSVHDEKERKEFIAQRTQKLLHAYDSIDSSLYYVIKPLYYGNSYYLYAYKIYQDVRLVFAPPSSMGSFGRDSDNWIWPRHAADFCLLRVYANAENEPAPYNENNRPYRPKAFFRISTKGVEKGDFVMVYGYPGSTRHYLRSHAVSLVAEESNPLRVALRDKRLAIMQRYMRDNDTIRIQYASKYQGVSNAWKRWQGERIGLQRMNVVQRKVEEEQRFAEWVRQGDDARKQRYGMLLASFDSLYSLIQPLVCQEDYYKQGLRGAESISFAEGVGRVFSLSIHDTEERQILLQCLGDIFFKNYDSRVESNLLQSMLQSYLQGVPVKERISPLRKGFDSIGGVEQFVQMVMHNSPLTHKDRFMKWLAQGASQEVMEQDSLYKLSLALQVAYQKEVGEPLQAYREALQPLYRLYVEGLRSMMHDKVFYPDANLTLRLAYGNVIGYQAQEAVEYSPHTTLEGVREKVALNREDYVIPQSLEYIMQTKEYGRWETKGSVPVCFLSNMHTTGGNSGSPVLNNRGELVGLNFDRVWEGTMSDIWYDPAKCRNINVDIRYVLFTMECVGERDDLVKALGI